MHAKDYFEWKHRGSPHVHGLARLQGAPDIESVFASGTLDEAKQHFVKYMNSIVCTMNPAILPDGSNVADAPLPVTNPRACNKPFKTVIDFDFDLSHVATCQRHNMFTCVLFTHKEWKADLYIWLS